RVKLRVERGRFMGEVVGGRWGGAGADIILAHRFLKNDVEPATYVLFTEAAAERLGIDPKASGLSRYTGRYAFFDEMACYVVSLDRAGRGGDKTLLGLGSLLGDLALGADPGPHDDLRRVVAA